MLTYLLLANFLRLSNEPLASEAEKWATIAASSLDFMTAIIGIMADPGFEEYKIILTVSLEILSKNNWLGYLDHDFLIGETIIKHSD